MTPKDLAQAFREGRVWGPRGRIVATAATLTPRSLIIYTAQTVLKLRLPGQVPAWDQTSIGLRIALAARERWVGRRISPEAYLDSCELQLAGDGSLILVNKVERGEPVVATWRQPFERRADVVLEAGAEPSVFGDAMAALARFHEASPEPEAHERYERPTLTADRWQAALDACTVLGDDERARLDVDTRAWLADIDKVLVHRVIERRVRDSHGDIALTNLFLVDPPVFIDAGDGQADDFMADTAEDVAQLAMELDLYADPDFSDAVVVFYAEAAMDRRLAQVLPLFKRLAAVRAATAAEDAEAARAFVDLALGYRPP